MMSSTEWDFEFNTKGAGGEGLRFLFHTVYNLYNDRYLFLFCFKFSFSKDKSWIDPVIILVC